MNTKIEYLDKTWQPIAMRCDRCSLGCDNCWHLRMCKRHAANLKLPKALRIARGGGPFALMEDVLRQPLRWEKPRIVGVQFMGDLFHENVGTNWITRIFTVMALCSQHTFCLLTKRPERALEEMHRLAKNIGPLEAVARELGYTFNFEGLSTLPWPIPNVWFGWTAENQEWLDRRTAVGLEVQAALRYMSLEPLLGPIDFTVKCPPAFRPILRSDQIGWVVVGPETGPAARPCNNDWIKSIVDQSLSADVPPFVKAATDPLTGEVTNDINLISSILGYPPEQLRQFPRKEGRNRQ